ncbi:MAG: ATP-dependent Clp protease proteolytic subunit [bacterium]
MDETYIRFMAPIIPVTTDQLLRLIDTKIKQKKKRIHLMISSPGGSVFHGLSLYNFLKGAPIEMYTYNFGSVDSIGVVVFCAGNQRFSVPHARFLIHGVRLNTASGGSFDEKQIEEHLKSIKIDQQNIARVIADTTTKPVHKVEDDMNSRTTLNPNEAKDYGLVHEIKSDLFPIDSDFNVIHEPTGAGKQGPFQITMPIQQGFTRSHDLDFGTV